MTDTESPVAELAHKFEAETTAFVREHRLPGAAVGVVHGDHLVWSAGVGFADVAAGRIPDTGTLYRIASITKTFTGTAIMQLRDEGRLHLDDPAVTHLPELRAAQSPFGPIETITIRRMLSHESGLKSEPPDTDWSAPRYEGRPLQNLANAGEFGTRVPPNTQSKYSNLAYQLLGEIVTRVSGVDYADYVRANIFEPLGLTATSFDAPGGDPHHPAAAGYAARSFSDELDPAMEFSAMEWAEGGLWSCVEDMARWVSFQLREDGGARDGAQVLAGNSLAEMHRARYLADDDWSSAFGISWYTERRDSVSWVMHSGGLPGYTTNVCFDPREGVGAIALLNGIANAAELGRALAGLARAAVCESPRPITPPARLPSELRPLLGLYADPEFESVIRVEWRDGKLTLIDPEDKSYLPTLEPTGEPDTFVISAGVRESGETCVFTRRPDGRVLSLYLGAAWVLQRLDPVE